MSETKSAKPHVCMTPSMYEEAKEQAWKNRQSFSEYVCTLIEEDLKKRASQEQAKKKE